MRVFAVQEKMHKVQSPDGAPPAPSTVMISFRQTVCFTRTSLGSPFLALPVSPKCLSATFRFGASGLNLDLDQNCGLPCLVSLNADENTTYSQLSLLSIRYKTDYTYQQPSAELLHCLFFKIRSFLAPRASIRRVPLRFVRRVSRNTGSPRTANDSPTEKLSTITSAGKRRITRIARISSNVSVQLP